MSLQQNIDHVSWKQKHSSIVTLEMNHLEKSIFYKIARQNNYEITEITIIINKDLEDTYEQKNVDFSSRGIPSHEILAFHKKPKSEISTVLSEIILIQKKCR